MIKNTIFILSLFFITMGCEKKKAIYEQPNYETVNNCVLSYQAILDVIKFSDLAAKSSSQATNGCLQIKKDSLSNRRTYHLNFGDNPCKYVDRRLRSGLMDVNAIKTHPKLDSLVTVEFKNYTVNGYTFNGKLSYAYKVNIFLNQLNIHFDALKINYTGNDFLLKGNLTLELNYTTYSNLFGSIESYENLPFKSNIVLGLSEYNYFYVGGTAKINTPNFEVDLNYGNFQNDSLATITTDNTRFIVDLMRF
jgi:hypothetical protein